MNSVSNGDSKLNRVKMVRNIGSPEAKAVGQNMFSLMTLRLNERAILILMLVSKKRMYGLGGIILSIFVNSF